jgi:hypothetical protein
MSLFNFHSIPGFEYTHNSVGVSNCAFFSFFARHFYSMAAEVVSVFPSRSEDLCSDTSIELSSCRGKPLLFGQWHRRSAMERDGKRLYVSGKLRRKPIQA